MITWRLIRQIKQRHGSFPFRITKTEKAAPNTGTLIATSDLLRVVVRENTRRDHVEDSALAQVYAVLRSEKLPVLLYQHYLVKSEDVLSVAQQLADYVGADLEVTLKPAA